jgi:ABC-type hemin transport system ATPase subunit
LRSKNVCLAPALPRFCVEHCGAEVVYLALWEVPTVAEVRERPAVSKKTMHRVHMERFNPKELNEVEGKERYRVEISKRLAALENIDTEVDVRKAWETIRENIFYQRESGLL